MFCLNDTEHATDDHRAHIEPFKAAVSPKASFEKVVKVRRTYTSKKIFLVKSFQKQRLCFPSFAGNSGCECCRLNTPL